MRVLIGVETAMLVLLSVLVAGLLRSHAEILRALHRLGVDLDDPRRDDLAAAPPAATQAYDVSGVSPDGDAVHIGVAGVRPSTLLVFLSSGCATCQPLWDGLRRGETDLPGLTRVVVVARGAGPESPALLRELAPPGVPVVLSEAAWADYAVPGSPYFVHVDGGRVVGEGRAQGWAQLRSLLGRAEAEAAGRARQREPA